MSTEFKSHTNEPISVKAVDLNGQGGMYCPSLLAGMDIKSSHPKVYLDIGKAGHAKCPYCGTVYALAAGEHVHAH